MVSFPISIDQPPSSLVTLPLYKFSHAMSPTLQSRIQWSHLPQRDNLFAVFDEVRERDHEDAIVRRSVMKIVHGGNVLVRSCHLQSFRLIGLPPFAAPVIKS